MNLFGGDWTKIKIEMPGKYMNKYRSESVRLQNWNYGWNAAYFITICARNRECFFGDVVNGKIQLSPVGAIANVLWYEIRNHAKNVELGEFIVMPNHVHGIIILHGRRDRGDPRGNHRTTTISESGEKYHFFHNRRLQICCNQTLQPPGA
jgi:REP element-mobilizing transposase RayT